MSRSKLPEFIHDVTDDPRQKGILVSGSLALFVVGLVPRALTPNLPTAQEALRSQPELQNLLLLVAFGVTVSFILGGLVSDLFRRRSLLIGGLTVILVASLISFLIPQGTLFYAANIASVSAAGIVLAYGIGSVAVAYESIPRATALGFVYAAYGTGNAVSPAALTAFPRLLPSDDPAIPSTFTFDTWLVYVLTAAAAGVAIWAAVRWMPRMPGALPASRTLITGVAVWSIGVLAIVTGVLGLFGEANKLLPILLITGGTLAFAMMSYGFRHRRGAMEGLRLNRRPIAAALTVGVAVGFARVVPLMLLPIVFRFALNYGTLFTILALVPFIGAMVLAGPISGILIQRFGPRGMMTVGTFALGLANVLLALALTWIAGAARDAFLADPTRTERGVDALHYVLFILPLVLVGAGFVLSTTVRTAIVFASTPRSLPGSAAAINEASVGLGSRLGIVVATTALVAAAVGSARDLVVDKPAVEAKALIDKFQMTLVSLGTPRFEEVFEAALQEAEPIKHAAYSVAYMDGVVVALTISGLVGISAAVVAWFLTGRRNPLKARYYMQDE